MTLTGKCVEQHFCMTLKFHLRYLCMILPRNVLSICFVTGKLLIPGKRFNQISLKENKNKTVLRYIYSWRKAPFYIFTNILRPWSAQSESNQYVWAAYVDFISRLCIQAHWIAANANLFATEGTYISTVVSRNQYVACLLISYFCWSYTITEPDDQEWGRILNGKWTGLVGQMHRRVGFVF